MIETADRVERKVVETVRRVLSERMGRFGFREAEVRAGEDHDGAPVLFIDARYDLSATPIDTNATSEVLRALREALEEIGERRFPHVRHHFDDRQQVMRSS